MAGTEGKLFCIGHMGLVAEPIYAAVAVAALDGAFAALGKPLDVTAGQAAVLAEIVTGDG